METSEPLGKPNNTGGRGITLQWTSIPSRESIIIILVYSQWVPCDRLHVHVVSPPGDVAIPQLLYAGYPSGSGMIGDLSSIVFRKLDVPASTSLHYLASTPQDMLDMLIFDPATVRAFVHPVCEAWIRRTVQRKLLLVVQWAER